MWRIIDTMQEFIDRQSGVRSIMCEIAVDTAADLPANTADRVFILGSFATAIDTGDIYKINSAGAWILQPSANAWQNVYTKAEIDSMITEINGIIAYYHTTLISDTGEITFYSLGGNVGKWAIYGNGQQTGTPTPDNPVTPEFVGVRTGNLFYSDRTMQNTSASSTIEQTEGSSEFVISKSETSSAVALSATINLPLRAGTYTVSVDGLSFIAGNLDRINLRDSGGVVVNNVMTGSPQTFTIDTDTVVTAVVFICDSTSTYTNKKVRIMLNSGSTALPYEPFGYKIPITCAGQTTPVYLGQTQTVRKIRKLVLTGEESWSRHTDTGTLVLAISGSDAAYLISGEVTCMCSHYPAQNNTSSYSQMVDKKICMRVNSSNIWIRDTDYSTTTDFKTYLQQQYTNGTPVTVWYVLANEQTGIVNEPLAKIGDYADELSSTDAGVAIPTVKGNNTLTVDTELKPSRIEIQGGYHA